MIISNEELVVALKVWEDCGRSYTKAAIAASMPRKTFEGRIKTATLRGLAGYEPVLPGFEIKQISTSTSPSGKTRTSVTQRPERAQKFTPLEGLDVRGRSTNIDGDSNIISQWVLEREGVKTRDVVAAIKGAFDDYVKPDVEPAPTACLDNYLTLYPCNDWHCGMFAWSKETETNWDISIAARIIGKAVEDVIARSKPSKYAVILGGGDLMHSDNNQNETAKSGNALDVDGRYPKILHETCKLVVRTVDAALRHHEQVIVRILPGNHDEHSSVAIAYFLLAWYRNEPRATIDVDPSLFWWHRFGKVLLGATHGHAVKLTKMAALMAYRRPEDWGLTSFRYAHGFHIHHRSVLKEDNGVICESHQAPIPQDAYHFNHGYMSGRTFQSIAYHKDFGESGRVVEPILVGLDP